MVIKVKRQRLGVVASFEYLGATVSDEGSKLEMFSQGLAARANVGLEKQEPAWTDFNKSLAELMRILIMSMFLCTCGSWALIAELLKGTWAFEMGTEHLVQ